MHFSSSSPDPKLYVYLHFATPLLSKPHPSHLRTAAQNLRKKKGAGRHPPVGHVCANELYDEVYKATWVVSTQAVNPDGFPRTGIAVQDSRSIMNPNSKERGTETEGFDDVAATPDMVTMKSGGGEDGGVWSRLQVRARVCWAPPMRDREKMDERGGRPGGRGRGVCFPLRTCCSASATLTQVRTTRAIHSTRDHLLTRQTLSPPSLVHSHFLGLNYVSPKGPRWKLPSR